MTEDLSDYIEGRRLCGFSSKGVPEHMRADVRPDAAAESDEQLVNRVQLHRVSIGRPVQVDE